MKKYIIALLSIITFSTFAQKAEDLVKWSISYNKSKLEIGEEVTITFKADIEKGWHVYGSDFDPNCGPIPSFVQKSTLEGIELVGDLKSINPKKTFDEIFECDITVFDEHAEFQQTVKFTTSTPKLELDLKYQVCTDLGMCLRNNIPLTLPEISLVSSASSPESLETTENTSSQSVISSIETPEVTTEVIDTTQKDSSVAQIISSPVKVDDYPARGKAGISHIIVETQPQEESKGDDFWSLFSFFWIAFGAGLIALITPCMFPMIPMTVNFFSHSTSSRAGAIKKALIYGFFIVIIYIVLGSVVGALSGPQLANWMATNWVPNLIFFAIFIIFGLSFLGMFEITLPSSFVNKMDANSEKSGLIGIFFMAFTLVLVSFSCTGPIAGSILLEAAGGDKLKPIIGMFGFGMAFAVPFSLFAMFPSALNKLPQSGGWLNAVKVVLGLAEFALALKFLSVADLTSHWGILDRDVFLTIWIAIFIVMSLYLLGKIRFPHDSPIDKISVPRSLLAVASISFVFYLIPGLWGAPLKGLAGILPPMTTQDFYIAKEIRDYSPSQEGKSDLCSTPLYSDDLEYPLGLEGYYDINEAIACAWEQDKPIFIDFTGHGCANCRMMESFVWSDPKVRKSLDEDFVKLALYADDYRIEVPKELHYTSAEGKQITTIADQATDFMVSNFNTYGQPYYVILDIDKEKSKDGKVYLKEIVPSRAFDLSVKDFSKFLENGIKESK